MIYLRKPPYRAWIGMMIFWAVAVNYCFQTYFTVTLTAMSFSNESRHLSNGTVIPAKNPNYGPRYSWTGYQKGQLVAAYFYGYTLGSIPGGIIAEYFGPYWTTAVSTLIGGVVTCLSVFAIQESWAPLFAVRFIVGFAGGFIYPALQTLIAIWAPPNEKGKFVACLMGDNLGAVVTQSTIGFLIHRTGHWKWGFFYSAFPTVVFMIAWMVLVSDDPAKSWFCSKEEAAYIAEEHEGTITKGKFKRPPILEMLKSTPFITLVAFQFGNLWGLNLQLMAVPLFMRDVLGFKWKIVGFLSSVPSMCRLVFGFFFGGFADFLIEKRVYSTMIVRKGFTVFSHILPGSFLFFYLAIGDKFAMAANYLIIVMGLNGACVITCLVNNHDLAPNYAGSQFGIMNFFGSMTGFIIPALVYEITGENGELLDWAIIFAFSGFVYISCGVLFIVFGSVQLQPWNKK